MIRSAYPSRPPADPAAVERGKGVYTVNCAFCHGSDARGGEGGPNLLRSQLVLDDIKGEGFAPVVQNGRPDGGMPKFDLAIAQISDIAAFLHSIPVGGRDAARQTPINVVVGDANAGKTFFTAKCASCHSVSGDLKGIAGRIDDPKTLQQTWMMPNGGGRGGRGASTVNVPPTTVTVTVASGQKVEGRLVRVDDFLVSLTDADGKLRSFPRKGDQPRVAIHEPMQPHLDLLPVYTDKEIHDVTAYLVTLK
jgi:mono/diheme cytochrome c family protein/small nuclear ribonucleoprotein (snRNP)-like protein